MQPKTLLRAPIGEAHYIAERPMRYTRALLLLALAWPGYSHAQEHGLTITYIANEGVLLRGAGRSVFIDALFGPGLPEYGIVPEPLRTRIETAPPANLRVDYVLATHPHRDHFNPGAVARYLRAVPNARFLAPRAAQDSLRPLEDGFATRIGVAGVTAAPGWIRALSLPHNPTRNPAENVGYIVELGGVRALHTGDAQLAEADWNAIADPGTIDVALVPYWYVLNSEQKRVLLERVRPRLIVLLHGPAPGQEGDAIRARGGWKGYTDALRRELPQVRAFTAPLEVLSVR